MQLRTIYDLLANNRELFQTELEFALEKLRLTISDLYVGRCDEDKIELHYVKSRRKVIEVDKQGLRVAIDL